MADITMCNSHNCEMNYKCYRYRAKPNEYGQSYFLMDDKVIKFKDGCAYYWEYDYENNKEGELN